MKKLLFLSFAFCICICLTACGSENRDNVQNENVNDIVDNQDIVEETPISNEDVENDYDDEIIDFYDDEYIYDDEIIEWDDVDNEPYEEEKNVVVEEVVNCDGCVYAYFSDEGDKAKTLGSTLSPSEYTTDINNLKTGGRKQRHNFFGLVLSDNTISKAYACILKNNKIYCIQGSTNGAYHTNNISILNQIFTADQCKYISAGHTYTCTDGDYNGDTITTGYASLHYETSCTIYGSEGGNAGKLICH
jgi:hypothetical protein